MKIHQCEQGTLDWLTLRLGRPTASEFDRFMDTRFAYRSSEGAKTYLYEKVAEAILRRSLPSNGGAFSTEQGQILEDEARARFELDYGADLRRVGFIESEDGLCGCSPDALADGYGVEIKAPFPQTHVRYRDEDRVPLDYMQQVHGSLYVTGFQEWRFYSYVRGLKPFLKIVPRDEETMEKIGAALTKFQKHFTAAMDRLK